MADLSEAATSAGQPPAGPRSSWRTRWAVPVLAGGLALVLGALSLVGLRVIGVWGPNRDPAPEATGDAGTPAPPSPFAGSPAEGFDEGAAGIVLPPAEPVGDFTAAEVATALAQVRQALVATRLDDTMLVDHDSANFVELVAAAQQPAIREAFDSSTFATFASQVADDAGLIPVPPRVAGTVSYRAATAERDLPVLEVVTRFVWVYAFELASDDESTESGGADIVVVRDEQEWEARYDDHWLESSRGMWLADAASHVWGVDCDAYQESLIRPGRAADPGQDAVVALDPEQPLPTGNGC